MSLSTSFHLASGPRGRWGCDYYMYTCMNPDSAQFHNMASNLQFWDSGSDHKILYHCALPLELDWMILTQPGRPILLDNDHGFGLINISSFLTK
jgi:hypothetical protein